MLINTAIKLKEPITNEELSVSWPLFLFLEEFTFNVEKGSALFAIVEQNPIWMQTAAFYLFVGEEPTKCVKVNRVTEFEVSKDSIRISAQFQDITNLEFLQLVQRQRYRYNHE